jgi:hypothetical protein
MDQIDLVEFWYLASDDFLGKLQISSSFNRSNDDRSNASCALNFRKGKRESDLVLWQSGEAELSTLSEDRQLESSHHESVTSTEKLAGLFRSMLQNLI